MTEADNTMGADSKEAKSRLEDIKYYTSLFLGTLCIVCVFGFLFLVPFVLDPAISTLMHDFVQSPVHCKVTSYELRYGRTNCSWASCREGCTASIYKCHQIRVKYTPHVPYENGTFVSDIGIEHWADLTRIERPRNPDTGELTGSEVIVEDTPLLINIKGCGYPPEVDCDMYAERYDNYSMTEETFPCYYSKMNPWIVLSEYSRDETVSSIMFSILIPNLLFVLSLVVLVYWYCPYCQARCRKYEEQTDFRDPDDESEIDDFNGGNN
ncbi:protein tipE [Eurytemora carolleeae]|uniref:protein tipE n=1 Tax=Eurytemora carolleeae TaxID=1294199 RepID=UPI000C77032F|nr:protein tipE [Eurytemora carolleeae]|eukprot:XP_023336325.1 protein tipE-like [Eurytemora affinis]